MMDQLVALAERLRAGLQEHLSPLGPDQVQGATLEVDPYWHEWARLQTSGHPSLHLRDAIPWCRESREAGRLREPFEEYRPWNFDARPPDWNRHAKAMGYGEDPSPW